jgi:hypothetical protein
MLARDRPHRVHVLLDQSERNARHVGCVLEQPAQAVGGADDRRIAERGGFSLDVVRGSKQFRVRFFGEALAHHLLARHLEALAFGLHPLREFSYVGDSTYWLSRIRNHLEDGRMRPHACVLVQVPELLRGGRVVARPLFSFARSRPVERCLEAAHAAGVQ